MYEEYRNVRGSVGIPKADLLTIDAEDSNQVCDTFGIHPNLPIIRDLYDADDVAFLAGIGILSAPVTKENYGFKTKTQLFAHNTSKLFKSVKHDLSVAIEFCPQHYFNF